MKIIFATNLTRPINTVLNELGVQNRLISYFYLKEFQLGAVGVYLEKGFVQKGKRTPKSQSSRTLWYHPESESYIECFDDLDAQSCALECVEVTGHDLHEANFRRQK